MKLDIVAVDEHGQNLALKIDKAPGICPVCRKHVEARFLGASLYSYEFRPLYVAFICPVEKCRAIFVAMYRVSTSRASTTFPAYLSDVKPIVYVEELRFPESVETISPDFRKIFNEAHTAEENGLKEVAGPGYRKALEFLVKDFLLKHRFKDDQQQQDTVLKSLLGPCIDKFIDDPRVKAVAKRAAWLGNDETHYYRRWDDRDIEDLKKLIQMTVSWIDLVMTSAEYVDGMPER